MASARKTKANKAKRQAAFSKQKPRTNPNYAPLFPPTYKETDKVRSPKKRTGKK